MNDSIRLASDVPRFAAWLRGILANSGIALRLTEPVTINERTWPPGGFPVVSFDLWADTADGPCFVEGAIELELEPTPDGDLLVRPLVIIPEAEHVWRQVLEALRQAVPGAVPAPVADAPRVPTRAADRERWQATWSVIETPVMAGEPSYKVDAALQESDLPEKWKDPDRQTLADIIAAGRAGLLS